MDGWQRRGGAATVDELQARARAYRAAVEAWAYAGWPRRAPNADEYVQIQRCLGDYLEASFPGKFSASKRSDIVLEVLREFIPLLHVRPIRSARIQPSPEDLLRWLDNIALDLYVGGSSGIERRQFTERDSIIEDEALTRLLLRADPAAVRAGMRALVVERRSIDFLIMTQYLDFGALDMTQPPTPADVAERLRGHYLLSGDRITEFQISTVLSQFRNRISTVA